MELLQTIVVTLVTLGILVTIHEYGHFWVARRCGVKVLRFSIGFGKSLYRWYDKRDTEFVIAAIPLGGYVKMLDEREGEVDPAELELAFNRKPVLQRIAVVIAGPLANFLLAVLAFWFLFVIGVRGVAPIIDGVAPDSIAWHAGLEPGQEILAVDGVATSTRQQLTMQLLDRLGESGTIRFTVKYPDSALEYESTASLDQWLAGEDEPDLLDGLGLKLYSPRWLARIGEVLPDSPAERAGLQVGDLLLRADEVELGGWMEWVDYVRDHPGTRVQLQLERDGELLETTITPARKTTEDGEVYGQVGVSVEAPEWPENFIREARYGPLAAVVPAMQRTWDLSLFTLDAVKKMLSGLISPKNLSGPISIAKVASASAKSGLESYIGFLALLSISLGVLNLLPIPVLDGGHLMFYLIELVKGSPVSEKAQSIGYQLGMMLLIGVMVLAFYNDLARL
jgi:regulator of sigma E protease